MTVLLAGVDAGTVSFLKTRSFFTEATEVDSDFFLSDWLYKDCAYQCAVVNFDVVSELSVKVLRKSEVKIPVIGLTYTASSRSERRANFLELGGDDFFVTPIHQRELAASINLAIRRGIIVSPVLEVFTAAGKLRIDTNKNTIHIGTMPIALTGREFRLLQVLAMNAGRVVSRELLLSSIYSMEADYPEPKILDVFVSKVRKIIKDSGIDSPIITTEWGKGYAIHTNSPIVRALD